MNRIKVTALLLSVIITIITVPLHKSVRFVYGGLDISLGEPGSYLDRGYPLGILTYTADTSAIYDYLGTVSGNYEEYYILTKAPLRLKSFNKIFFAVDALFWFIIIFLVLTTYSRSSLVSRFILTFVFFSISSFLRGIYGRVDILEFRFGYPFIFLRSLTIQEIPNFVYWHFSSIQFFVDLAVWFLVSYLGVVILREIKPGTKDSGK